MNQNQYLCQNSNFVRGYNSPIDDMVARFNEYQNNVQNEFYRQGIINSAIQLNQDQLHRHMNIYQMSLIPNLQFYQQYQNYNNWMSNGIQDKFYNNPNVSLVKDYQYQFVNTNNPIRQNFVNSDFVNNQLISNPYNNCLINIPNQCTKDQPQQDSFSIDTIQQKRFTNNSQTESNSSSQNSSQQSDASKLYLKRNKKSNFIQIIKKNRIQKEKKKQKVKRKHWTYEEDQELIKLVTLHGRSWSKIQSKMKNRSSKRIRERYLNYLDPSISKNIWTLSEDIKLINLWIKYENKWSIIRVFMKGRSDSQIKNRFNSFVRKIYDLKAISKNKGSIYLFSKINKQQLFQIYHDKVPQVKDNFDYLDSFFKEAEVQIQNLKNDNPS